MNPQEILDVARRLAHDGTPAACRSAISRAYYAAFHAGADALLTIGVVLPSIDGSEPGRDHIEVSRLLERAGRNARDRVVEDFGNKLSTLRTHRNEADYLIDERRASPVGGVMPTPERIRELIEQCEQQAFAELWVVEADRMISALSRVFSADNPRLRVKRALLSERGIKWRRPE